MSLQVSVDHEYLVAARMWAGSLPDLLMMLLNVFLQEEGTRNPVFNLGTSYLPACVVVSALPS